jgi:hypothetical protein
VGQSALWAPRGPLAGSAGARGNVLRFARSWAHAGLPKSGGHPSNVLCRPDVQPGRHDGTILAPAALYRSRKRCPQPLAANGPARPAAPTDRRGGPEVPPRQLLWNNQPRRLRAQVPGFRVFGSDADVVEGWLFASRPCRGHPSGSTAAPGRARSRTPREQRSQPDRHDGAWAGGGQCAGGGPAVPT